MVIVGRLSVKKMNTESYGEEIQRPLLICCSILRRELDTLIAQKKINVDTIFCNHTGLSVIKHIAVGLSRLKAIIDEAIDSRFPPAGLQK